VGKVKPEMAGRKIFIGQRFEEKDTKSQQAMNSRKTENKHPARVDPRTLNHAPKVSALISIIRLANGTDEQVPHKGLRHRSQPVASGPVVPDNPSEHDVGVKKAAGAIRTIYASIGENIAKAVLALQGHPTTAQIRAAKKEINMLKRRSIQQLDEALAGAYGLESEPDEDEDKGEWPDAIEAASTRRMDPRSLLFSPKGGDCDANEESYRISMVSALSMPGQPLEEAFSFSPISRSSGSARPAAASTCRALPTPQSTPDGPTIRRGSRDTAEQQGGKEGFGSRSPGGKRDADKEGHRSGVGRASGSKKPLDPRDGNERKGEGGGDDWNLRQ
jgi:hypothetical protein